MAFAAGMVPRDARGDELLVNPGFEDGTTGWQSINAALAESTEPRSGLRALAVTSPGFEQAVDVWQLVQVQPGRVYEFSSWMRVADSAVDKIFLRVKWLDTAFGSVSQSDSPWLTGVSTSYRFLSTGPQASPLGTAFARLSVVFVSSGPFTALVDDASLIAGPTPSSSTSTATTQPTPTPHPTQGATPTPSGSPVPPGSTPTASPSPAEPRSFQALVNGGFEFVREDGTAFGWRKNGGEARVTGGPAVEGSRSLELASNTSSTKWVYQTVSVRGGRWYLVSGWALAGADTEVFLRVSWYGTDDGSGTAISSDDSATGLGDGNFHRLTTGAVQAPMDANSVKVRLMMRPSSSGREVALFDAVTLDVVSPQVGRSPEGGVPAIRGSATTPVLIRAGSGGTAARDANDGMVLHHGFADPVNVRASRSESGDASQSGLPGDHRADDILAAIVVGLSMTGIAAILARELVRERR